MDYVLTFLEGVMTFVSPCMLPMLPIYLAYFAGDRDDGGAGGHTLACALGFVLGFGLVFSCLGAFSGVVGGVLLRHARLLDLACGTLVTLLGLNYLGLVRIPLLERSYPSRSNVVPRSFGSSVLFGLVFAVSWSPCVGTFLASALSLAAATGSALRGVTLLVCFSAGLGVPFILAALLIDELSSTLGWLRANYGLVNRACGVFLVMMGILMATGTMGTWLRLLS